MTEPLVLLVEDDPVHQRLVAKAFEENGTPVRLRVHADAESGWADIETLRALPAAQWPAFAIIDIGLPGTSGIDLVDRIRQVSHFDAWPVVMLTGSQDPEDRVEALLAHATGYFAKPAKPAGYPELARQILAFVRLPPGKPGQPSREAERAGASREPGPGASSRKPPVRFRAFKPPPSP
jgi:CheY-like chemotaxis protein